MPERLQPGKEEAKEMRYAFFAAWLTAAATIDSIFSSKGAMMTFVIAMIVIVACAAAITRGDD